MMHIIMEFCQVCNFLPTLIGDTSQLVCKKDMRLCTYVSCRQLYACLSISRDATTIQCLHNATASPGASHKQAIGLKHFILTQRVGQWMH